MSNLFLSFTPKITQEFIDQLQKLVNEFILHIHSDDLNKKEFIQCIDQILVLCFGISNQDENFLNKKPLLIQGLVDVHNISACKTNIWTSDGKSQTMIKSSLGDLLLKTLDNNYHKYQEKCKSLDKTGKCTFNNQFVPDTTDHIFSCSPFHEYDSVSMHLVLACMYNALWGLNKNISVTHCALLGLYHDIGKPLTVETIEFKNATMTGFPAHAEVGCMLFQMHWNSKMLEWISESEYFAISKTILRHMCGYHGDHGPKNFYKRELLLLDPMSVRTLMSVNRVGDHFGKLVPPDHIEPIDQFLHEQIIFEQEMTKQFNFQQILKIRISADKKHIYDSKLIIYLIGRSGSGKTFFADALNSIFPPGFVSIISRDCCIAEVCVGVHQRLIGMDYVNMYKIYEAGKNLYSFIKRHSKGQKLSKREIIDLQKLEETLIGSQIYWNNYVESLNNKFPKIQLWDKTQNPDFTNRVHVIYSHMVQKALVNHNSVFVVMDTMMNCFPQAVESCVPDFSGYFRIHVHIQSYNEIKDSTVAESMSHQLKISGPSGPNMPMHPDGFKTNKDKKLFASLSSDRKSNGFLPDKSFKSKFSPHLVFVCTRTEQGNFGYDETFTSLKKLCSDKLSFNNVDVHCNPGEYPVKKTKTLAEMHIESRLKMRCKQLSPDNNPIMTEPIIIHVPHESNVDTHIDTNVDIKINLVDTENQDDTNDFFGVNPETKGLNVKKFYEWVFEKFSGDRSMIQEYMKTQNSQLKGQFSFMHTSILDKTLTTMKENDMILHLNKLSQLSKKWQERGIVKQSFSSEDFASNDKLYEIWVNSLPCLKYYEQWGARFWTKYAIEMRGTVLFVNPCDQVQMPEKIKILTMKLPRGAEAVTGMILRTGIETQDVKPNKIKILDLEQQDTCRRLCREEPINMYLTSKGDGSLLSVTAYTGQALNIILPVIEEFGSDYTKLWAEQSMRLSCGKRLIIPATQGTLLESGFMAPYMVTAILSGSKIIDRNTLANYAQDYCTAWKMYGERWILDFLNLTFFDTLSETHTFNFEAICENRRGLFGDQYHTELACLYERDQLIFLGVTICEKRFYVPHFIYSQKYNIPWEEPLYWKITHGNQVNLMIDDLESMVLAKLSKNDYLTKFPPSNIGFNPLDPSHINNASIHYEGWVGMKIASYETTDIDHINVMKVTDFPLTSYSKIKIKAYYEGHKFHTDSIPYLIELAKTAGHIFPMARKIAGICKDGVIVNKLEKIGIETMKLFDFKSPDNQIIKSLENSHKEQLIKFAEMGEKNKLPKSPLTGFFDRTFDVQCRIALKASGSEFNKLLVPIFLETFPEIDPGTNELDKIVTQLIMEFKPWNPGYLDRIKDLNPTSPCIQGLIVACVGTSLDIVRKPRV